MGNNARKPYVLLDFMGNELDRFPSRHVAEVYLDEWPEADSIEDLTEQNDETTSGSNETMSNYDFISNGEDDESDNQSDDFSTVGNKWDLGDHSTASSNERHELSESIRQTMDALDDDVDGDLKSVLEDASNLVEDTSISRFECPVEACGLGHSHPDHKHDIRSGFNVEDAFAGQMQFCPYCHCGVNELSMLMAFFPYITEPVFTDQHEFEGVLEVEPDVLEDLYNRYNQGGETVSRAVADAAIQHGRDESDLAPLGVREDLKRFFQRRQDIENAANAAPIAQETRGVITQNREALEEQTSQ
jgi:hypothetical protein